MNIIAICAALFVVAILANFAIVGLASSDRAVSAAENLGYHNAHVVSKGPAWGSLGGCTQSDEVKFKVEGIAPDGTDRVLTVCASVPFGGYTVRS